MAYIGKFFRLRELEGVVYHFRDVHAAHIDPREIPKSLIFWAETNMLSAVVVAS